jgi:hypothetical protein
VTSERIEAQEGKGKKGKFPWMLLLCHNGLGRNPPKKNQKPKNTKRREMFVSSFRHASGHRIVFLPALIYMYGQPV